MESYDDDDDTHYCNKCHETIVGLDNYVRHRQSGCRTTVVDKGVYHCPPASEAVSYPEILNADAFFSSLQLQSSSKTQSSRPADLLGVRTRSGRHEEKKKRLLKDKSPDGMKDESKEKMSNLLPVDADSLDGLDIPPLVGFPDLVPTSSAGKPVAVTSSSETISKPASPVASSSKTDGIKHERKSSQQDESQQYAHSDWPENIYEDEMQPLDRYGFDYEPDEETCESSDEDMVQEDSYSDDEDHPDYPPRTHTGGKWKPGGIGQEDVQTMHDDEPDVDVGESHHDEHPPPSYTGGKWKPPDSSAAQKHYDDESNRSIKELRTQQQQQPPDNHTRGKWVPGARADMSTGFWCNPCGRRLASEIVYKRHLLSDLHARRSIQEIVPSTGVTLNHLQVRALNRQLRFLTLKKLNAITAAASQEASMIPPVRKKMKEKLKQQQQQQRQEPRRRKREKTVLTCDVCNARVRRTQMGKHLRSYYHCHVTKSLAALARIRTGTSSNDEDAAQKQLQKQQQLRHQRFVLDNIANIVRQCPFQCAPCHFYCNTENEFLRHWRSDEHKRTVSKIGGSFICPLCNFWCDDNESMEEHIMKQGHQDAVSMINGSVPMVMRRQQVLACSTCSKRFRYNIELRVHAKYTGHKVDESASDEYQCRMRCSFCSHVARSQLGLQRHHLSHHKAEIQPNNISIYFCSYCSMNFKTVTEATNHRRTSSHKEKVRSSSNAAKLQSHQRVCTHCKVTQSSLLELKQHMLAMHSELCYQCGKCGKKFGISQDLAVHTRDNLCDSNQESASIERVPPNTHQCDKCSFKTKLKSEMMFHKILHGDPIANESCKAKDKAQSRPKYPCSVCKKPFTKTNLRQHLRVHTGEKPYSCFKCGDTYKRRVDINLHYQKCLNLPDKKKIKKNRERKYVCDDCGDRFYTKFVLRQHILRHAGKEFKCGLPGCPTVLRTENELKRHRDLVHNESKDKRPFKCEKCSYAAKNKIQIMRHQKIHDELNENDPGCFKCSHEGCNFKTTNNSHLRRHFRLHMGLKPYKCRHCSYASSNVENLRKHVLSTKIHSGKMIYECNFCEADKPFGSNYSKELRAHLLESHPDKFSTPNDARKYTENIFKQNE